MNRKLIVVFVGLVILITGALVAKKVLTPEKIHYHAGFVVFVDGQKQDFTDIKYMNVAPCVVKGGTADSEEDTQMEKAHLHDNVGDVVHVEEEGSVWQDLFINIKYPIDYASTSAYLNGQPVSDFQKLPIMSDDSLVIFVGTPNPDLLSRAVTREHIDSVGKKSESCSE